MGKHSHFIGGTYPFLSQLHNTKQVGENSVEGERYSVTAPKPAASSEGGRLKKYINIAT